MARHLALHDVLPRVRPDLNVRNMPAGAGAEVISVGPVETGERVNLHGFEFQIAMMLDGKRTAGELLAASARLGLPLELPALEGFLDQLESGGLLMHGAAVRLERNRRAWTPAVRALFRAALNDLRLGHEEYAREDLEQLLRLAPATPEALALEKWLETHHAPAGSDQTFQRLLHDVELSWSEDRTPQWRRLVHDGVRPRWSGWLGLGAIVAVLVATLLVPLPRVVTASARLTPLADDASRMAVRVTMNTREAASIHVGQRATLHFGPTRVQMIVEAMSGYEIAGEVANSTGALAKGSAPVDVELAPQSIFWRVMQ